MPFTEDQLVVDEEIETVQVEDDEATNLDEAKSRLDDAIADGKRPFVMYRYTKSSRRRTAILFQRTDGEIARLTFKVPKTHPVKQLLETLAAFLYPDEEDGFAQQSDLLSSIQAAMAGINVDEHYFDGGQGKAG